MTALKCSECGLSSDDLNDLTEVIDLMTTSLQRIADLNSSLAPSPARPSVTASIAREALRRAKEIIAKHQN